MPHAFKVEIKKLLRFYDIHANTKKNSQKAAKETIFVFPCIFNRKMFFFFLVMNSNTDTSLIFPSQCLGGIVIWVFCAPLLPEPESADQTTSPRLRTDSPCVNKCLWGVVGRGTASLEEKNGVVEHLFAD